MSLSTKIKKLLRIPKKHHLDYIAALISVPVLFTVIVLNVLNLSEKTKKEETTPTTVPTKEVIIEKEGKTETKVITVTPKNCKKEVGPISISYPEEGEKIKDNPVCVNIKYEDEDYCSVVWSYRVNGGTWSEYSSNSVCLYNMPKGDIKFELRVQSTASSDKETLTRKFVYDGSGTTATSSAEF